MSTFPDVNNLHTLPTEIIRLIMFKMRWNELKSICNTSRKLQQIGRDINFWTEYMDIHRLPGRERVKHISTDKDKIRYIKRLIVSGNLYICLAEDLTDPSLGSFKINSGDQTVYQVSCNMDNISYVTAAGSIYNVPIRGFNKYIPQVIKDHHNVEQIACGYSHTVFITADGNLYGFGSNMYGQLGETRLGKKIPLPIQLYRDVKRTFCGPYYTIWITTAGEIYAIGNGIDMIMSSKPVKINVTGAVDISCGYNHLGIIDAKNNLYMYGCNANRKLGRTNVHTVSLESHKISSMTNYQNVAKLSCGTEYTVLLINGKIKLLKDRGKELTDFNSITNISCNDYYISFIRDEVLYIIDDTLCPNSLHHLKTFTDVKSVSMDRRLTVIAN